jgi:hypothetical protein
VRNSNRLPPECGPIAVAPMTSMFVLLLHWLLWYGLWHFIKQAVLSSINKASFSTGSRNSTGRIAIVYEMDEQVIVWFLAGSKRLLCVLNRPYWFRDRCSAATGSISSGGKWPEYEPYTYFRLLPRLRSVGLTSIPSYIFLGVVVDAAKG